MWVMKAVWRERSGQGPPEDLQGFGGIGVVCMGDFAQLSGRSVTLSINITLLISKYTNTQSEMYTLRIIGSCFQNSGSYFEYRRSLSDVMGQASVGK